MVWNYTFTSLQLHSRLSIPVIQVVHVYFLSAPVTSLLSSYVITNVVSCILLMSIAINSHPRCGLDLQKRSQIGLCLSRYAFGGQVRSFTKVNKNIVKINHINSSCKLFLSMYTFIILYIIVCQSCHQGHCVSNSHCRLQPHAAP